MCGIVGIWGEPGADLALAPALREILHRGPDGEGVFRDVERGLALGHRRLSVIDLTPTGDQPMSSEDGRYVLAYNGEIYNFGALRTELGERTFRGTSDTEVLLRALTEWGVEAALARLNGMFAFCLWDRQEEALWVARDRLGIKPVYHGLVDGRFVVASELRALRPFLRGEGRIDPEALALYLRYGYVPGTACIYRGLAKLSPGHVLRVTRDSGGRVRTESRAYWSALAHAAGPPVRGEGAPASTEALLLDAVRARLVADVPVGAFLSGGVDSSTVVALMCEVAGGRVETFSIGFEDARFDEAVHAKKVATHLGTVHHEHYVRPEEALAVVPELGDIYSEPFADSSQVPTTLVARLARRHVTVALSGDGGDELFGGYRHYHRLHDYHRRLQPLPRFLRRGVGRGLRAAGRRLRNAGGVVGRLGALPRARRRLIQAELLGSWVAGSAEGTERFYEGFMDHWRGDSVARCAPNRPLAPVLSGLPAGTDAREAMMLRDLLVYLPDDILTKVDRATMSASLEARVPLLDHRVVEHALHMPLAQRIGGAPKQPLREILYRRVPRALIERPKMGFSVPLASWLRGPLRDWGEALLAEGRLRAEGHLHPSTVRRCWMEHQRGVQDWSTQLWDVLMFQSWLDAEARAAAQLRELRRAGRAARPGSPR